MQEVFKSGDDPIFARREEVMSTMIIRRGPGQWMRDSVCSFRLLRGAIIKLPACLRLLTLETYNLCFIASKLLTVADMMAI